MRRNALSCHRSDDTYTDDFRGGSDKICASIRHGERLPMGCERSHLVFGPFRGWRHRLQTGELSMLCIPSGRCAGIACAPAITSEIAKLAVVSTSSNPL